jgi:predicted kinase
LYDATTTRRTYEQLMRAAAVIVEAGFPAIVDATFLHHADRQRFRVLAERLGAQLTIVVCEAGTETLRARVAARAARGNDVSDATLEVLAHQVSALEAPADGEKALLQSIDTDTDFQTLAARCAELAARLRSEESPRAVFA